MPIDRTVRGAPALLLVAVIVAAACGTSTPPASDGALDSASAGTSSAPSIETPGSPDPLDDLVAAAEQEGALTTIGLSHEWCGYGELLETFTSRYAITINELNPGAGFEEQLAALRGSASDPSTAPDVIDVDIPFAARAKAGKLLAPYKVSTWSTIPKALKDAAGAWYGGYYGVLVFETNTSTGQPPPVDWGDFLQPSPIRKLALAGDPRVSSQAIETVYAAALANGGSLGNAQPGLAFFKKLKDAGNLLPTIATVATIDDGTTPVTVRWTYNALAHRDVANGEPEIDVSVPKTGRLGGAYAQAISAAAPHPNAAKLWMEFLFSDEGQGIWLNANCYPVRLVDLEERGAIPPDVQANLLDLEGTVFPSLTQLNAASALISGKWNASVGVDIK